MGSRVVFKKVQQMKRKRFVVSNPDGSASNPVKHKHKQNQKCCDLWDEENSKRNILRENLEWRTEWWWRSFYYSRKANDDPTMQQYLHPTTSPDPSQTKSIRKFRQKLYRELTEGIQLETISLYALFNKKRRKETRYIQAWEDLLNRQWKNWYKHKEWDNASDNDFGWRICSLELHPHKK